MNEIFNREKILAGNEVWPWYLLAFQAGAINSAGYLACHRFVSHVTGFGTRMGIELGLKNYFMALEMSFKFFFFFFGALLVGFIFYSLKVSTSDKFLLSISTLTLILLAVFTFGELGIFGKFGEPLLLQRDIALLCSLCFACGVQNAATSISSNGLMRTTHLTGLTTDLATGIAKLVIEKDKIEWKLFKIRFSLIAFFALGATLSAMYSEKLEFKTFLIPFLSSTIVLIHIVRRKFQLNLKKQKNELNQSLNFN